MKKTVLTLLMGALLGSASSLQATDCSTMAGGIPVVVPSPEQGFPEVGTEKRDFFEYMVPSGNRLLCAFVPAEFLPRLKNPAGGMRQYMLVELSRKLDEKNTEVTSAMFEKVVLGVKGQIADPSSLMQTVQTTLEEINRNLKQLESKEVSVDKPTPLGTLFQTSDAYAFAILAPVSSGGTTSRIINASVLLRVRDRLIFAYVYGSSDDENSLKWVEKTAEQWTNGILIANSKSAK